MANEKYHDKFRKDKGVFHKNGVALKIPTPFYVYILCTTFIKNIKTHNVKPEQYS